MRTLSSAPCPSTREWDRLRPRRSLNSVSAGGDGNTRSATRLLGPDSSHLTECVTRSGKQYATNKLREASEAANPELGRMAFKMATGSGKTVVIAMSAAGVMRVPLHHPPSMLRNAPQLQLQLQPTQGRRGSPRLSESGVRDAGEQRV
jgi:hypothetical protein